MARPRNTIPKEVSINMFDLAAKLASISDDKLAEWVRKAVTDWQSGCADPDTDQFIRKLFTKELEKMKRVQETQAKKYRNRVAATEKNATTPLSPIRTDKTDAGAVSLRGSKPESASHCALAPASNILQLDTSKKPYGTCGHVMLTDAEGHHLRIVYGENLKIAIDILDAYIENNGKAAKKYKNHAAVLRKGNWVYEKVQNMILAQKRIDNVSNGHAKDFKTMREDEQRRRAFTSLYETTEAL
jgi:hypothetical protein